MNLKLSQTSSAHYRKLALKTAVNELLALAFDPLSGDDSQLMHGPRVLERGGSGGWGCWVAGEKINPPGWRRSHGS